MSELYFGRDGTADVGFPADAWERAQHDLAPAEAVLRDLGRRHGLELLADLDGRVAWPARRLRSGGLLGETQVRLLLNPEYLNDGELFYTLDLVRATGPGWLRKYDPSVEGGRYSADELRDSARLAGDVESLIERAGLAAKPS